MRAHGVRRAHVAPLHEPARQVCPDRQERNAGRPHPRANGLEVRTEARVSREVHRPGGALDPVARPEGLVAVEEPAAAVVLRGERADARAAERSAVPPVKLHSGRDVGVRQERPVPEAGKDNRRVARGEPRQRREVHVVVVIMAEHDRVDVWEVLEADTGRVVTPRPEPWRRPDAPRPHRVGEDVEPRHLDEQRAVVHEGDAHVATVDDGRRARRPGPWRPVRRRGPGGPVLLDGPPEEISGSGRRRGRIVCEIARRRSARTPGPSRPDASMRPSRRAPRTSRTEACRRPVATCPSGD